HHVPIVDRLTLDMIKQLIRIHKPKRILEIGTAIGYSSMQFASVSKDIKVVTIERDVDMQLKAKENFAKFGYHTQIELIEKDALEAFENIQHESFDMIYIDVAKAQSKKIFTLNKTLLRECGIIVTDKLLWI